LISGHRHRHRRKLLKRKNPYIRRNAQNPDEIGIFEKVGSMKSTLSDEREGQKEHVNLDKRTR
jgi:hypothetical protein